MTATHAFAVLTALDARLTAEAETAWLALHHSQSAPGSPTAVASVTASELASQWHTCVWEVAERRWADADADDDAWPAYLVDRAREFTANRPAGRTRSARARMARLQVAEHIRTALKGSGI